MCTNPHLKLALDIDKVRACVVSVLALQVYHVASFRSESPSLSRNKKKAKPSNNKKSSLMTDLGLSDDGKNKLQPF